VPSNIRLGVLSPTNILAYYSYSKLQQKALLDCARAGRVSALMLLIKKLEGFSVKHFNFRLILANKARSWL
jgi:hypothetical protein